MEKIQLQIFRLVPSYSNSNVYILMLSEMDGNRKLPVVIGEHEARSIALELEGLKFIRPLTHELIKTITDKFSITLNEVLINDFKEGIFYAKLFFSNGTISNEIDARTSDAITLALKYGCPIYTTEDVLKIAGAVFVDIDDVESDEQLEKDSDISIEKLKELLNEAEKNEEYEKASKIMQEIEKRKKLN